MIRGNATVVFAKTTSVVVKKLGQDKRENWNRSTVSALINPVVNSVA